MTLKHNMSEVLGRGDSVYWSLLDGINSNSNDIFIYVLLVCLFLISAFYFIRKTSDIGKSFLQANYIVFLLSLILYFGGKVFGSILVSDLIMLFLAVELSFFTAVLVMIRWKH